MKNKEGTSFSLLAAPLALAVAVVVCGSDDRRLGPVAEPDSSSYIVQAESVETAKELVETVGGLVTHELGIIRSVGAELSAAQMGELETLRGVDRVFTNGSARISVKPPSEPPTEPATETVRDDFNIIHYNNNDGSQS